MKTITKFVAEDGTEFKTESACKKHETLLVKVEKVNRLLRRAKDSSCEFSNGGGYIQHTSEEVTNFKSKLVKLCKVYSKHEVFRQSLEFIHPGGLGGRILEGSPIYSIWMRLYCVDSQNREWGQPYYALHPTEGKQIEWRN